MCTLIDRLDDVYITDIVYLLDVLVVIVYMSYCNCWDYLFIIARGLGWVLKKKKKMGGGRKFQFFFPTNFFFFKCSWSSETHAHKNKKYFSGGGDFGVFGAPHAPTRGSRGVGKRYTSCYDHDMWPVKILERSGLAVKSYHPETLANKKNKIKKNKKNSDKTIRHSRRGMPNKYSYNYKSSMNVMLLLFTLTIYT